MRPVVRIPLFPWLLAAYPALNLLSQNLVEVRLSEVWRPLVTSVALCSLIYLLIQQFARDHYKSALVTSLLVLSLLSYGHLYNLLKAASILGVAIGRHRYLAPAGVLVLGLASWLMLSGAKRLASSTPWINAFAFALLLMPLAQILALVIQSGDESRLDLADPKLAGLTSNDRAPDIYYIILDTYMRADVLVTEVGYDNSQFLESLRELGFYVANCSRSNYEDTLFSLSSSLNMAYLPELSQILEQSGLNSGSIFALISHNRVRSTLEQAGYKTVAFQTGFDWTDWRNADLYLSVDTQPLDLTWLSGFEVLFLETTVARLALDARYALASNRQVAPQFRFGAHVELQRSLLDQLPRVPSIDGPTFAFAHVLIPHVPYVFAPDGQLLTDPGYFSAEGYGAVSEDYLRRGYSYAVEFIDRRMIAIVSALIQNSDPPPVIIIQGDHGLRGESKLSILNAYFFPPGARDRLYLTISPVNSFRILLSELFGADLDPLPDRSYRLNDPTHEAPETSDMCRSESPD